ncbi:nuclear transport factor 2 family protein [Lewinella sp. IMCC34183]|uniref:nuclear transport factor 2 family protein n=1 Tax=Lewinella sp. IMCC34183 TaxID=2248762 RepID=UPI001300A3E5|nr:nuclear transport factor 2 family protein [Lewinella sp. IMCC34183]
MLRPLIFLLLLSPGLVAQSGPAETLTRLFDGMRRGDTTGMGALFHPAATLHSVSATAAGGQGVQQGDIGAWLAGVAAAQAGDLDEQLHYTQLRTDAGLATAWTPYTFVLKGEVHHCGTNAFQLVRDGTDPSWRILNIVDTRRTEGCTEVDTLPVPRRIDALATAWHRAAARADSAAYFDLMTGDAIFIGTDPGEHWNKEQFLAFAGPYFAAGKAWDFTATERHVFYDAHDDVAWWDELLDTWMGACRGTGVATRDAAGQWKIAHYTLSLTIPNDQMEAVRQAVAGE